MILANSAWAQDLTKRQGGFAIDLSTGLAVYPDLQVPFDQSTGLRADATEKPEVSSQHIGVPIRGKLGYEKAFGDWGANFALEGMMVEATDKPAGANYQRVQMGVEGSYLPSHWRFPIEPSLTLLGRRSYFKSFSVGHRVETLIPLGQLTAHLGKYAHISGFYGQSVLGNLSYNGQQLAGSSINLQEMGAELIVPLSSLADFHLGFSEETIVAQLSDVYAYRDAGLQLTRARASNQNYFLQTHLLRIGFAKRF
jgi:hypothetical protein